MVTKVLWIGQYSDCVISDLRAVSPDIELVEYRDTQAAVSDLRVWQHDLIVMSADTIERRGEQEIQTLLSLRRHTPVVIHVKNGSIDDVVHFTGCGAFQVFIGRFGAEKLLHVIDRIRAAEQPKGITSVTSGWRSLVIGRSRPMLRVCEIIELIAKKRCTVLISGETGTGKEVIAKAIHAASNRASQPLVAVNCTALPTTLVESELFGHTKGAFTGAHTSRLGRFEQANRGTIFLDEIGDLPIDAQSKLLRVLQEQEFQRVGSSDNVRVDVRVIAATNVDLQQAIKEKKFREDLYYRLNVVPIRLPPLRERREDIALLAEFFMEKVRVAECAQPKQISQAAMEYLTNYDWPGNVRELEHAVQMAFALSGDRQILTIHDFRGHDTHAAVPLAESSERVEFPSAGIKFHDVVTRLELSLLNQAIQLSHGNKARAAELLGIKRTTLLAKMKALNFPREHCA